MSKERVFLSAPNLGAPERRYADEALATGWVSAGENLEVLEREFSRLHGGLPCVALASGTAAIHLGLKLLGVKSGDEVVCSSLTFAASANPIVYEGGRPVFVDSDRTSWNVDPDLLAECLAERAARGRPPAAVIVVHLYGHAADMDRIEDVCRRWEVPILEDAAEALGADYRGQPVGTRSPVSAFSFNANKIITTGSGGMLVARDRTMVDKARFWSQQSRENVAWYEHRDIGYNYRLSNIHAGVGRGQLESLATRVDSRRGVAARYADAFAELKGVQMMPEASWCRSTRWLSAITIDFAEFGATRDELLAAFSAENIEARPVWKPLHMQPVFSECRSFGGSVSEDLFARGICLPSSTNLSASDQARVIDVVRKVHARRHQAPGVVPMSSSSS